MGSRGTTSASVVGSTGNIPGYGSFSYSTESPLDLTNLPDAVSKRQVSGQDVVNFLIDLGTETYQNDRMLRLSDNRLYVDLPVGSGAMSMKYTPSGIVKFASDNNWDQALIRNIRSSEVQKIVNNFAANGYKVDIFGNEGTNMLPQYFYHFKKVK